MSVTYTEDTVSPIADDTYVPAYARKPVRQKKVRTWMVLAPIAAVALIGGGTFMLINNGGETAQPLVEPAAAPAASPMSPAVSATEAAAAPMTAAAAPAPVAAASAPAPVVREAAPVRRAAPVARRESASVTAAPRVETPAQPSGPQPYAAATSSLNTATPAPAVAAPAVTPAPAPAAPAIVVQPLN
jgi:hypothetical protein